MENRQYFQGQQCLVLGLAKSGYAAALLLNRLGASVVVNDQKTLDDDPHAVELQEAGIEVIGGGHPADLLERPFDMVVKNPGIPYDNPVVDGAVKRGIPVVTEPEIAGIISSAPFIAITGSNGKTTTTTLIGEMLKQDGKKALVAGNIGTVVCEVAAEATQENIIVAELSSFQLLGTKTFHPHISVFLNLFDAHLDYHGTRENYGNAKARIFANQTENDFAVLNADDEEVMALAAKSSAEKVPFSVHKKLGSGVYIQDEVVYFNDEPVIRVEDIVLPGKHNLENILASVAAAKLSGARNDAISVVLKKFKGVRHRMQFVETINGRRFYNDSKATNLLATEKAIAAFDKPVILLAGGLDRGNGFEGLVPALKKLKAVVAFGETAPKIIEAAEAAGMERIERVDNLEEAVPVAFKLSDPDDVVLLSPACASWDQFRTFEERGDMFIEYVHKLR
ncbi:MAG TPA: UDP-N-acetylmuramoyl-L-alanine--D-glutamate ligase [Bacillales bacterium]|nr:UDP-N-acetylmuramoyl-L-alanine--D-glutamate ligase [Bacillales bacterium]